MFGNNNNNTEISLEPKNGNKHILLVCPSTPNGTKPEVSYTSKVNEILEEIQNKGYEVLDVKLEIGRRNGLSYEALIIYK
ncbi:MAG: hypothetical protein ACI4ON_00485 [Clostridia bacterium]